MKVVERFPHEVRVIENSWIPLADGTRLAARIWLPVTAATEPVPAILEYLPYRKRDFTRMRDAPMHHYFSGHGYACVRVDVRGSGDSDGVLLDEYSVAELDDAVEVIAWLAAQPWCTGSVGMMGISWGGFNALQVAARAPAELAAIITLCASDDRYADDAHYMGGCLLNENLTWGSVLTQFNAYPPDPAISGPDWQRKWLERLEAATLFPAKWLRHQRRDAYWQRGSVCEDFSAIRCPVYAIGGWADGYSNAVPRLLAGLDVPCKGLVGPWAHAFPHDAIPGPSVGFLQDALRWWDRWLKGIDNGVEREPTYRAWMQEHITPAPFVETRPGRWVAEPSWPSERLRPRRFHTDDRALVDTPASAPSVAICSLQTTGLGGGDWCAFGAEGENPVDQRRDDGTSAVFDSEPLGERMEILGAPVVELAVSSDSPSAFVAVRLNDVAPDGSSLRVTYGLLNLTHRSGHDAPEPLEPGRVYRVRLALNDIAHAFPAGHRVRLAVSTAYWPIAWPSPTPVTLTIGASWLDLPVRPPTALDDALPSFESPERAPKPTASMLRPGRFKRAFERDLQTNETSYTVFSDEAEFPGASLAKIDAIDLELAYSVLRRYRIAERDPSTAVARVEQKTLFRRDAWQVAVESDIELRADESAFRVIATLRARLGDEEIFVRQWDELIDRDHV